MPELLSLQQIKRSKSMNPVNNKPGTREDLNKCMYVKVHI